MSSFDLNQSPSKDPPEENTTPSEVKERGKGSGDAVPLPVKLSFHPIEEELIGFYLFKKVTGKDDVRILNIPECDLYGTKNPWEIWQEFLEDSNCEAFSIGKSKLYLFTTLKRKDRRPSRFDRTVGEGKWKREDTRKRVYTKTREGERVLLGFKKRYSFDKSGSEHRRSWVMMEYSLDNSLLQHIANPNKDCVICMIKKIERTAPVGTGENEPLELKDADAATGQGNDD